MAYFVVADFKGGLDSRRIAPTATPGTLRALRNAAINRGGEIEKRKAFVPVTWMRPGTFGLASVASGGGYPVVFCTGPYPGNAQPPLVTVTTQQVPPPTLGLQIQRVLNYQHFAGSITSIIEWDDDTTSHFVGSSIVTAFSLDPDIESGRIALTFGDKRYVANGSVLYASGTSVVDYDSGTVGVGLNDMSTNVSGSEAVTGLAEYDQYMAVFSRRATQIWSFAADPDAAARVQTLNRIGTPSPRSALSFGGNDVLFLSDYGIRSLRARTGTDTAAVSDIGSPVDDLVVETLRTMTDQQLEDSFAEIEPTTGRYWLTMAGTTYVFSYFPGAKVSAWSMYDLPNGASHAAVVNNRLYVRAFDTLYLYGGTDGATYDDTEAEVEMPFLDGRQIATWKQWKGLDVAAEGTWKVYAAFDPAQPDAEDEIATLTGSTFYQLDTPMFGYGPLVKLRFVSQGETAAKLSSVVVHYAAIK